MTEDEERKLTHEDFIKMAILKLRDPSRSRGIHSVFSGFNDAFREYFGEDPINVTQQLASEGKIAIRPAKRGVMIYLPDDAPISRQALGKTALSKILKKPAERDKGLVEQVIDAVVPEGAKRFPEDFLEAKVEETLEINVPGTPLQLVPNSQTTVVSPKRHFRYEAKNPPEAKYIIYANKVGQKIVPIPKDTRTMFKAVTSYEKYCQNIEDGCFTMLLQRVNDESIAEHLAKEVIERLDLRATLVKGK